MTERPPTYRVNPQPKSSASLSKVVIRAMAAYVRMLEAEVEDLHTLNLGLAEDLERLETQGFNVRLLPNGGVHVTEAPIEFWYTQLIAVMEHMDRIAEDEEAEFCTMLDRVAQAITERCTQGSWEELYT